MSKSILSNIKYYSNESESFVLAVNQYSRVEWDGGVLNYNYYFLKAMNNWYIFKTPQVFHTLFPN